MDIIWKGRISLDKIQWTKSDFQYQLPEKFEMDKKKVWESHIKQYPDSYNGQLVYTSNIILGYDNIKLLCRTIEYNDLLTLRDNKYRFSSLQGNLSFILIIKEKGGENYLVGKRTHNLYYQAGFYTSIGGMFERDDLKGNLFKAIEREVSEECSEIRITPEIELISIIREEHGLGITMIFQTSISKLYEEMQLDANNEWDKNKLHWLSIDEIRELGSDILVEDLQILIN